MRCQVERPRAFFVSVCVAALSAFFARHGNADDAALTNERILANLTEVVFGSEFVGEEVDFVRKWGGP